jgi:hypothetical protein
MDSKAAAVVSVARIASPGVFRNTGLDVPRWPTVI